MKIKDKILEKINESPGLTSSELAKEFIKSKGNISVHLENLEKEELIKKYLMEDNQKMFKIHPIKKRKKTYLKLKKILKIGVPSMAVNLREIFLSHIWYNFLINSNKRRYSNLWRKN